MKPQIWVKSYSFLKEISTLSDLGKEGVGIEVFLGQDTQVNEECARICRNEFQNWGVELFVYQDEEKRASKVIYDIFSPNKEIAKISSSYFHSALGLAEKWGAQHLQLDSDDGYIGRPEEDINKKKQEFIQKRLKFLESLKSQRIKTKILYENTIPIDDHNLDEVTNLPIFSCIGHNLSDFGKNGLPLEYDIAHHAVALDVYTKAGEFNFPLTEQEKGLVRRIREKDITSVIIEELQEKERIYFVHLSNAQPFRLLTKTDVSEGNSNKDLLDLRRILPVLSERSENIAPEVGEPAGDFKTRPYLRKWVKALQTGNYQEVL